MICNTIVALCLFFTSLDSGLCDYVDKWKGIKYELGGNDCSSFTQHVYCESYCKEIPRTAAMQYGFTRRVLKKDLKPGDLVFFHIYRKPVSHVGIYIGDGQFLHMSVHGVKISDLNNGFYKKHYIGGGRLK